MRNLGLEDEWSEVMRKLMEEGEEEVKKKKEKFESEETGNIETEEAGLGARRRGIADTDGGARRRSCERNAVALERRSVSHRRGSR